jgi:hypothetical protein
MQFDSINEGKSFYSLYDQTNILDIAGSYRIGQWKFSLVWKYRTGLAALPGIRTRMISGAPTSVSSTQSNTPPPPPGTPAPPAPSSSAQGYSNRFPDYHQLDASVYYSFPKEVKKYKGSIGVSVLNCYDQVNIIEQTKSSRGLENRVMPGLSPNLFITFSF